MDTRTFVEKTYTKIPRGHNIIFLRRVLNISTTRRSPRSGALCTNRRIAIGFPANRNENNVRPGHIRDLENCNYNLSRPMVSPGCDQFGTVDKYHGVTVMDFSHDSDRSTRCVR